MLESDDTHAEPTKPPPQIPVRVFHRSELRAALRQKVDNLTELACDRRVSHVTVTLGLRSRRKPPSGSNRVHEIKHDGYRLMARRDSVGIRLLTRRGNDWAARFPLVVEAVNHLKVRSC
jgi:ATP-dependent DNA ligase